jgi:predicted rRNA methylase YqxC with S4 and FtsJ domains
MWSFLSFSGRWEPKHLAELPPVQSNAPTAEQMQKTRVAVEARTRYRQGKALALHVEQKKTEKTTDDVPQEEDSDLRKEDKELLARYYDDSLRKEANRLTLESGNGRLHSLDGKALDIGGSTGGYTRKLLQNWREPDTQVFEKELEPPWRYQ